MSEVETYTLRKNVEAMANDSTGSEVAVVFPGRNEAVIFSRELFQELFVAVSDLQKQLREAAQKLYVDAEHSGYEYFTDKFGGETRRFYRDKAIDNFLDEILGLVGLEVNKGEQ